MKRLIAVLAFIGALLGNAAPMSRSNVNWVLSDLRNVADSPNYYWAWTYEWLNHAGVAGDMRNVVERDGAFAPKPLSEVELACDVQKRTGGRTAVLNYADLASLAYYPGDEYVDIIGLDDYSIGNDLDVNGIIVDAEKALVETVRKLRLMTAFAERRGKIVAISESGGKNRRDDFWNFLHRAATADGVKCAFVNTWWGKYGTTPNTVKEATNQMEFIHNPSVLLSDSRRNWK